VTSEHHDILTGCRALICDWDGTLADTTARNHRSLCAALAPHGVTVSDQWYRQHRGLPIRDLIALLPAPAPLPIEEIVATSRATLLTSTTPNSLAPIPAVVDLVRRSRAIERPCAVASGAAAALVTAGLDALGLRDLFQAVVTCEDVQHGKPAPDTFLTAAHRLGVAPEQCLVVEDAPDGVTAAHRAGMPVLLVDDGHLTLQPPS